ncbi:TonB-dependent receptor plug domain-containing protein, partial [Acinetobacter baumannii]
TQDARSGTIGYLATRTSSATKTNTALINVPQSVTVLTKDFLKDTGSQSVSEAIRYVPGLVPAQGEGNRDQLVIRGQNTTADFFVDGLRD